MINLSSFVVSAGKLRQIFSPVFHNVLKKLQQFTYLGCRYLQAKIDDARFHPLPLPFSDNWCKNGKKGFTLLELMMVIAIIGTLSAIAIPNYIGYRERASIQVTLQTMRMIDREISIFNLDHDRFPDSLAEVGLDHLRDPWGNPYQYLNHEKVKGLGKKRSKFGTVPINNDFDLYSMGPDGKTVRALTGIHARDDIVRANNGSFFGKASNY